MPYNKEQLKAYWQANKVILNQRRKEKRRLAKLGLAISEKISHNLPEVSQIEQKQVSHLEVSHHQASVVEMANPLLTRLIKEWQTSTSYSCPPTCFNSYCSNCWYFRENELIDYKELSM